jgi:molybdenum-dependent DNA-binding transcriptional regulator ModE
MEVAVHWVDRIGRRLKLRDLHFLMTVAQSGTMAKAAQQLAVSQPVVSKTISDLEHTLGVPLLDRTRHGRADHVWACAPQARRCHFR